MVIDFHTHIFPEKIAKKTIKILEDNITNNTGTEGKAVIGATIDELLCSMNEHGIDYSVVLPIATNERQSVSINEFASGVNSLSNVFSLGSLHPMQEDWESVLYDIKEKGLKGIKLHPEYQQFYIDSPESVRILKKCEELDLIVVLHTGKDIGINSPVHCSPKRLRHVLDYDINGSKVVAGHLGGWMMWDDVEKYLVGTNILFDTAFTLSFINENQLLDIIKNHGSEKILFATDSPWENQGYTKNRILSLPISEREKDNILGNNAKRLLQIQ